MGKLYEPLRREPERPPLGLPASAPLRVAPVEPTDPYAPSSDRGAAIWASLFEGQVAPFIEVPDGARPLANDGAAAPGVVPFRAPIAEAPAAAPNPAAQWHPLLPPQVDECYRQMAQALLQELKDQEPASLLLLPLESAGNTGPMVAELSVALLAELQKPVLLVDVQRHPEGAAARLEAAAAPGWEELLLGLDWPQAIQRSRVAGLDVIVAGNRLAHATPKRWAQLAGRRLRALEEHYRFLLISGPHWPESALGLLLAAETKATCVVVSADAAEGRLHQQLTRQLLEEKRRVLGALVLN
jgi:hypothetical protein